MPTGQDGQSFLIPQNRRLTWDLLWFNGSVPQCGHDLVMNLSELAAARSASRERISWPALFLQAFGTVSAEFPELRQTWYRWPIGHIYQHSHSVGILTIQRKHQGRPWLFWGRFVQPETMPLLKVQAQIDQFKNGEVTALFRKELQLSRLPTFVRRLAWWWNLNVAKGKRAKRVGTFFLSTLSGKGVEIQMPPSVQTGCLTFGPLNDLGECRVTLAYDHRIMDGVQVADILQRLEQVLLETGRSQVLQQD